MGRPSFRRLIHDAEKKVLLIVDNLRVHHGKLVQAWLVYAGSAFLRTRNCKDSTVLKAAPSGHSFHMLYVKNELSATEDNILSPVCYPMRTKIT